MGSRPPTPASCPIVLNRKEPGRELEPLQRRDHGLFRDLTGGWGWGEPVAYHGPTSRPRLEVARVGHVSSAAPPDGNGTLSQRPRPRPHPGESQRDAAQATGSASVPVY